MKHEQSWIALAEILGPRSPFLKPLVTKFGTPDAVFAASEQAIRAVIPDIGQGTLAALLRKSSDEEAARITLWCHRNGVRILTLDSTDYPARLREIDEPPAVLYCKGAFPTFDGRLAVGVVGTRKADAYGEQVTYKLSFELAAAGAVIVSGMAAGLDAIAAAAAINAGSETIAVLGCGIDLVYPKIHTRLATEITAHGAIITEYAPGTKPHGWNFPMRNRIISALSSAVLVTEAGENSGSLITARYAVVQGKELFAVPGDITSLRSKGTNRLLCDGAIPALEAGEMLERFRFLYRDRIRLQALPEAMQYSTLTPEALRRYGLQVTPAEPQETPEKPKREKRFRRKKSETVAENTTISEKTAPDTSSLTPRQRELFDLLPEGSFSVDVLASRGVPVAEAMSTLTVFEIYGFILSRPGGVYQKK
ncbi:MAG: DNA-processing protein DprA [Clostridia bacterium]|nr:DNA-processing protein DprA [Clostridia bacterium]